MRGVCLEVYGVKWMGGGEEDGEMRGVCLEVHGL